MHLSGMIALHQKSPLQGFLERGLGESNEL